MKWLALIGLALTLAACAGLQQFPKTTKAFKADLIKQDEDYATAIDEMAKATTEAQKAQIRNKEIDRRLAVIDNNFHAFEKALARESVAADFGVALAGVGVGATGALVTETASQILSAVSGGLAGAQAAYQKSVLFDQSFPALLAQMRASRKAILVGILAGRADSTSAYPLSKARSDLNDYIFAGSLPGAIQATAADAKQKADVAEAQLADLTVTMFSQDDSTDRIIAYIYAPHGDPLGVPDQANLTSVRTFIDSIPTITGLPIASFVHDSRHRAFRELAIYRLNIP